MADITVTPANVIVSTGATKVDGTFGETVTAGAALYKKSTDSEWYLAQADSATEDDLVGIALDGGANAQPGFIQTRGNITIGGTVAIGQVYVVSALYGKIAPWSDLVATNYVTIVGIGISATVIQLTPQTTGVQIPAP